MLGEHWHTHRDANFCTGLFDALAGAPNTWKLSVFLLNFSPISSRLEMYYPVFCSNNETEIFQFTNNQEPHKSSTEGFCVLWVFFFGSVKDVVKAIQCHPADLLMNLSVLENGCIFYFLFFFKEIYFIFELLEINEP